MGALPDSIADVFELLNKNYFLGLIRLDILTVMVMPLYLIMFYSISRILKTEYENDEINNLLLIFLIIGFTLFLSTANIFQMMELSHRYKNEQNEIIKKNLLIIGETLRVSDMWRSTGTVLSGIIIQICAILYSILMIKGKLFKKITGIIGIVTFSLDLIHIFVSLFFEKIASYIMVIAGTLYLVWFPLLIIDFNKIRKYFTVHSGNRRNIL